MRPKITYLRRGKFFAHRSRQWPVARIPEKLAPALSEFIETYRPMCTMALAPKVRRTDQIETLKSLVNESDEHVHEALRCIDLATLSRIGSGFDAQWTRAGGKPWDVTTWPIDLVRSRAADLLKEGRLLNEGRPRVDDIHLACMMRLVSLWGVARAGELDPASLREIRRSKSLRTFAERMFSLLGYPKGRSQLGELLTEVKRMR